MLVEEKILDRNPAKSKIVYRPDTRAVDRRYLELWECKSLLEAAKDRDYLILRLLLSAALRPSELFALRVNDIGTRELRIDEVAIPGEDLRPETKTEESAAPVPISEETELLLRAYASSEQFSTNDLLFPSELGTAMSHENWRSRNLMRIVKAAGIDDRVDYRIIRRTVATHMQKDGSPKDIQALLRHADIKTTLGVYQQAIPESVSKTVDRWEKRLLQ
jgi:integrase